MTDEWEVKEDRVWTKDECTATLSIEDDRRHLIVSCETRWPTMFEARSAVDFLIAPDVTMTMLLPSTQEMIDRKGNYPLHLWETRDPMIHGR